MKNAANETWRVFCAIELPVATRALVLQQIAKLKQAAPDARASWARDTNLHVTLKFLGDIPQAAVAKLSGAAQSAAVGVAPFEIRLETAGAFPPRRQARVLWIGISDPGGKLNELQSKLDEQAALAGFPKEAREFHPHVTIARLRNPQQALSLPALHQEMEFKPVEIMVNELLVIRSELSSAGSKYTLISRHPLTGPQGRQ
jgi:RNA 2',3'-cyclic 3'-phosphodiesterase